jgi:cytochrome c553
MTNNQKIDNDRDQLITNHQLWLLSLQLKLRRGMTIAQARSLSSSELNFCSVCHASDAWPLCDHCTEIAIDVRED